MTKLVNNRKRKQHCKVINLKRSQTFCLSPKSGRNKIFKRVLILFNYNSKNKFIKLPLKEIEITKNCQTLQTFQQKPPYKIEIIL